MPPATDRPIGRSRIALAGMLVALVAAACGTSRGSLAPTGAESAIATAAPTTVPSAVPGAAAPRVAAATLTPSPTLPPATPSDSLSGGRTADELIRNGRLVSCIDFPTPVMAELDEAGKPIGVNVEIATEIAERLGLEVEIRDTVFETLLDDVAGGRCDISVSGQIITRTRLVRIAMIPYLQGVQHVVVRDGNPTGITTLIDLCGQVLAVQSGTTHVDLVLGEGDQAGSGLNQQCAAAGRSDVDLRQFPETDQAVDALESGAADAYIGNDFVIIERPGIFELAADLPPIRLGIGVGLTKPSLRAAVDGALADMIADGTYAQILDTYDVLHLALTEGPVPTAS